MTNKFLGEPCISERDKAIASAIAFHLVLMNCKNCLVSTSVLFLDYNTILNIVCWLLIFVNYARLIFFKNVFDQVPVFLVMTLCFLFSFCCISQIINPDLFTSTVFPYNYVRETMIKFLGYCLPCFVFCSILQNPYSLLLAFYRNAWILFAFSVIAFFLYISSHSSSYEYSMSYANAVGFTIFVFLFLSYERKKIYYIVAATILTFCLVICGSRGPLISITSLMLVYFMFVKANLKIYIVRIIMLLSLIFLLLQHALITSSFIGFLDRLHIQSRTLRMLSMGVLNNDSGRLFYFEKVFDALNASPLLGLGAFGGSVQVGKTHNLYLDICANFGYFVGIILILFVFYSIFKIFRDAPNYSLLMLFFSLIIFPRGFFGFDFWGSYELWVIFGLIVSYYSIWQSAKKRL